MLQGRMPVFPNVRNPRVFVAQISVKHEKQAWVHFIPNLKVRAFVIFKNNFVKLFIPLHFR